MNIGNEHAPKIDLIKELVKTYYLFKTAHYQAKFVRDFVNKDFKKRLSDAAAKNNYFCVGIESIIPNKELAAIDEIAMQILEKMDEVDFNQKVKV